MAQQIDYFAKINQLCPPWVPEPVQVNHPFSGQLTDYAEDAGSRVVHVRDEQGELRLFNMPFFPYVRAVDPAGNLLPLITGTCRDPAEDVSGYASQIISQKKRAGWLIAEPHEEHKGYVGQEYGKLLFDEMASRKAKHKKRMDSEELRHRTAAEKALEEERKMRSEERAEAKQDHKQVIADVLQALIEKGLVTINKPKQV